MKPIDILKEEHQIIKKVLNSFEQFISEVTHSQQVNKEISKKFIHFLQTFADQIHHGKEEKELFVMMEKKGFSFQTGPVAVMVHEHETGRQLIQAMIKTTEINDWESFCQHANEYVNFLNQHIDKEDHCLFAMADQAFNEEDQQHLLEAFQNFESQSLAAADHQACLILAQELNHRLGNHLDQKNETQSSCCSH